MKAFRVKEKVEHWKTIEEKHSVHMHWRTKRWAEWGDVKLSCGLPTDSINCTSQK